MWSARRSCVAEAPTVAASALLSASTEASRTTTRVRSAPPSLRVSACDPARPSAPSPAVRLCRAGAMRFPRLSADALTPQLVPQKECQFVLADEAERRGRSYREGMDRAITFVRKWAGDMVFVGLFVAAEVEIA